MHTKEYLHVYTGKIKILTNFVKFVEHLSSCAREYCESIFNACSNIILSK